MLVAAAFGGCLAAQEPSGQQVTDLTAEGRLGAALSAEANEAGERIDGGGSFNAHDLDDPDRRSSLFGASRCPGAHAIASPASTTTVKAATLSMFNFERRRRGLPRLRLNRWLDLASRRHSADLVARAYFRHDSLSGASFTDRLRRTGYFRGVRRWAAGENLAWGRGSYSAPAAIVRAWMNSPRHRRNLLSPRFSEVGIGVVFGVPRYGRRDGATITIDFGRRR